MFLYHRLNIFPVKMESLRTIHWFVNYREDVQLNLEE